MQELSIISGVMTQSANQFKPATENPVFFKSGINSVSRRNSVISTGYVSNSPKPYSNSILG
jgi:hypothetical protein